MARILLGWELGANSGHSIKLAQIAARLGDLGHEPILALQQTAAFSDAHELWQAPLWPGLVTSSARRTSMPPATMGDILGILGLGEGRAVRGLISAWDQVLRGSRPDAIIAEFAPALMLAARGKIPLLAAGTGFSLPPAHLSCFPNLSGSKAMFDEAILCATLNEALVACGSRPVDHLPEIFAADRSLPSVFAELDPYRRSRREALAPPSAFLSATIASGGGEEIFVYTNGAETRPPPFWQALAGCGHKVRVHDPALSASDRATLARVGVIAEEEPVAFDDIAARSRMIVSHGGLGMASSALLAGLPHLVLPFDLEKRLTADSVEAMDLGRQSRMDVTRETFVDLLQSMFEDGAMIARCAAAAHGFRDRVKIEPDRAIADAVLDLL